MFVLDKAVFGAFLCEQRKRKGMTQKELAEQLYVSDKAVSKWERGLSMPDISLLIPLSRLLDVSVTELLEGKKLESASMDAGQVEALVQRALTFSEDASLGGKGKRLRALGFAACSLLGALGMTALLSTQAGAALLPFLLAPEILCFIFGVYFFFFARERLPGYYDENHISAYSDGVFRMNLPGVRLHNGNWRFILRAGRIWAAAGLLAVPFAGLLLTLLPLGNVIWPYPLLLVLYLAGLFVPMYLAAKKHDAAPTEEQKMPRGQRSFLRLILLLGLLLPLALLRGTGGEIYSGTRIGYVSQATRQAWSASYLSLNGTLRRRLFPAADVPYQFKVETQQGALSAVITDSSGALLFEQENIPSGAYELMFSGPVSIRLEGSSHQGSFSITPK